MRARVLLLAGFLLLVVLSTWLLLARRTAAETAGAPSLLAATPEEARASFVLDLDTPSSESPPPALPAPIAPASVPLEAAAAPRAVGALTGRLVDHHGQHIRGRRVTAFIADTDRGRLRALDSRRTNAEGVFLFSSLPAWTELALLVDGEPAGSHWYHPVAVPEQERVDLGEIRLPAPYTLVGRVVDGDGNAVAGARIRGGLLPDDGQEEFLFSRSVDDILDSVLGIGEDAVEARTDGDGQFALRLPPDAKLFLRADHPEAGVGGGSLDVPTDEEVVMVLAPPLSIRGVVRAGDALAPADTLVLGKFGNDEAFARARVDERGRFELADLAPGEWELLALPPGWFTFFDLAKTKEQEVQAGTEDVELQVVAPASLDVTVLDAAGKRAAAFDLTVVEVLKGGWPFGDQEFQHVSIGRDGHAVVTGLRPVRVSLCARASDGAGAALMVAELEEGQMQAVTLHLTPVVTLRGRVVDDATDLPLGGAELTVRLDEHLLVPEPPVVTHENGLFAIPLPSHARFLEPRLKATAPRYLDREVVLDGELESETVVRLVRAGALQVRLSATTRASLSEPFAVSLYSLDAPTVSEGGETKDSLGPPWVFGALRPGWYEVHLDEDVRRVEVVAGELTTVEL